MTVSMANARADVASRTLRAIIVHEVRKIAKNEPDLSGWERDAVKDLLGQKSIDPATLPAYEPSSNPTSNPVANPWRNPTVNPTSNGYGQVDGDPPADPPRTPEPEPAPFLHFSNGGYESSEGHQRDADPKAPPTRYCSRHPNGTADACLDCQHRRELFEDGQRQLRQAALESRHAELAEAAELRAAEVERCDRCDDDGYRGAVVCDHCEHSTAEARKAAMAAIRGES